MAQDSLKAFLSDWAGQDDVKRAVMHAVIGIASAGRRLSALVSEGPHGTDRASVVGNNLGGDAQKALDVQSHDIVAEELRSNGVGLFCSEEADEAELLNADGLVAVATDPLDGSSNIDCNVSIGTIFSVMPMAGGANPFFRPGREQLAAGYVIYGPHTDLVFTLGDGTLIFTLDRFSGVYRFASGGMTIPATTGEFAINASNYRHWSPSIRRYFDDCLHGASGPRERDFNMRWIASLVAEASRVLSRGGVFLYPCDNRRGYAAGRLRLVYEANPIAMVIEQAGGRATDGTRRILDIPPVDLHQRTGLVFGSADEVATVAFYESNPQTAEDSPLFGYRGLFRAADGV